MDAKDVIERAKNSTYFEVTITLNGPMHFNGRVPFDMKSDGTTATFNVLAESHEEADALVRGWMNGNEKDSSSGR